MNGPFKKVGYLGLGTMGAPIAGNLLKTGYPLVVWNRTRAKGEPLAARGATVADSPVALARAGCDAIFLNLSDGLAVRTVLFGPDGIAAHLAPGTIVLDNSTIGPQEAQEFAAELKRRDVDFLDAPVSGGQAGAAQGTLSVMVGGDEAAFQRSLPLLHVIGKSVIYLGPSGMGQACKACNQVAVICNLLGVCEAAALARKLGLDPAKLIEVLGGGGAASQQLKNYGAKIFQGDMKPGFMIRLMLKDLGIAQDTAQALQLSLEGTALAQRHLRSVAETGGGDLGTQAMSRALEKSGGFHFTDSGQ
jgi:3-hydroxyisobutyrate dehydrogenase-like beta-hydroxyacid dehydrogenase